MSFNANFYTFKKKPNSTAIPSSSATTYSIELVDSCSIINPIIRLRGSSASDMLGRFNYCYIPTFNRYYFVTDAQFDSDRGIWNMFLEVDVLATAKSDILASTQYVERSATNYDLTLPDNKYPTTSTPSYAYKIGSDFFNKSPLTGDFIIGVVCNGASSTLTRIGGTQYYVLNNTQMSDLMDWIMQTSNYMSMVGLANELTDVIADPTQFIVSCKFFPRTLLDLTGYPTDTIRFGGFNSNVTGTKLPNDFINPAPVIHDGFSLELTDHPQKVTRGSWLNGNGTTERILRFEPFGLIPLDSSKLIGYSHIYLDVATDIITGSGILTIYASQSVPDTDREKMPIIGVYPASVLIDIPLSSARHQGYLSWFGQNFLVPHVTGANKAAGSIASGGGTLGGIVSMASVDAGIFLNIPNAIENFFEPPHCSGVPSSFLCRTRPVLCSKFMELVDEDLGEIGRPCCKLLSLANRSGYFKCFEANIATNLTAIEDLKIRSFLNNGFFIE